MKDDIPTLYVGETSRSIYERGKEHYEGARRRADNNHMVRHVKMEHKEDEAPNFSLRVVKHYKTALARQVAEAVRIRRRGGEGAILNSRGEFSRSYIPRLTVKEEDEEKDRDLRIEEKRLRSRTLREQDVSWEQLRREEMGDDAKLGPTTSPVKRGKEQMEERGEEIPKKRRRKLQYEVLGADWGEQDQAQGAPHDNEEPQSNKNIATTREEEPYQGAPQYSLEPQLDGSPAILREHKLKQVRISDFLNPGATTEPPVSTLEWPTVDNPTASTRAQVIPLTEEAGGRSPCGPDSKNCSKDCEKDISFVVNDINTEIEGKNKQQDILSENNDAGNTGYTEKTTRTRGNTVDDKLSVTPSGGESTQLSSGESMTKDDQNVNGGTNSEKMNDVQNECDFKRGGMCRIHMVRGTKVVTKTREWVKRKNGLYGYVTKQLTTYKCSGSAVLRGHPSPTVVEENVTGVDSGLELGLNLPGDNLGCSVDTGGAGANKSESSG